MEEDFINLDLLGSGYLFTMNADVANKPAVVNRHFTNGQDCYLNVRLF